MSRTVQHWTYLQIIESLHAAAQAVGHLPTSSEYQRCRVLMPGRMPTTLTISRCCRLPDESWGTMVARLLVPATTPAGAAPKREVTR